MPVSLRSVCQLLFASSRTRPCHHRSFLYSSSADSRSHHHTKPTMTKAAEPFHSHRSESGLVAHTFFHQQSSTWQYVVADPRSSEAVVIDTAYDYDSDKNVITTETADSILEFIKQQAYSVTQILESHAHADHLTAAQYYKAHLPSRPPVGIGEHIREVQKFFGDLYGIPREELADVYDVYYKDGQEFNIGKVKCSVMHLPGHTPDHIGYRCGDDFVFVGDSLFLPDVGSARADFPGGSVDDLHSSAMRLLSLPEATRVFSGHDYPGTARSHYCSATVGEQKSRNKHLKEGTAKEDFVDMRRTRDSGLAEPKLLHQSLQINIRAGHLPRPRAFNGKRFIQVPLQGPPGQA